MKAKLGKRFDELFRVFPDHDPALEWCENRLLDAVLPGRSVDRSVTPDQYELFASLSSVEAGALAKLLKRRSFQRGEVIIQVGDEADELFFLARGTVSVVIEFPSGGRKRLATFSPGMVFGEMAVIDRAPRSALIIADSKVECDILTRADLDLLGKLHPNIKIKLLENLCIGLCRKLRKANRELTVFE